MQGGRGRLGYARCTQGPGRAGHGALAPTPIHSFRKGSALGPLVGREFAALCRELDARPVAPQGLCCCPLALVLCAILLSCHLALPRAFCPQQLLWKAFQDYSFECLSPILLPPPCPPATALSQHQAPSASVQFANPSWRLLTLPTQTPWRQGTPTPVSTSPQLPLMDHCPSPQRWAPVPLILISSYLFPPCRSNLSKRSSSPLGSWRPDPESATVSSRWQSFVGLLHRWSPRGH